jgi:enterochelin esterase-like enzyme
MKQTTIAISLILCLLIGTTGCSIIAPAPPTPIPTPACSEDGYTEQDRVESPTLGWKIDFEVYLPPCYAEHTWAAYPVLYLIPVLHGGMADWKGAGSTEIANRMIHAGEIPPFIIVSPANYPSDSHGDALMNDLFPHIEENYRTLNDRTHRAVGGASMGGAIAYRMAFRRPDLFSSVGIFGSGVVSGDEGNLNDWIAAMSPEQWPRVLLDCGDGDTPMLKNTREMARVLDEWEIPYTLNVEPGGHSYAYWGGHLEMYYKWYAEDW